MEKLSEDVEAQTKLSAVRDPDEACAIAGTIHGGYTREAFIAAMTAIVALENMDLTAEDLMKAAGGGDEYVPDSNYYIADSVTNADSNKEGKSMNENVLKLLDLMSKDEELQKRFAAIHDVDEAYALAVSIHGGYTKEELFDTIHALRKQMEADLSEGEMAATAGGFPSSNEVIPYVTWGASAVSSITLITAITIAV